MNVCYLTSVEVVWNNREINYMYLKCSQIHETVALNYVKLFFLSITWENNINHIHLLLKAAKYCGTAYFDNFETHIWMMFTWILYNLAFYNLKKCNWNWTKPSHVCTLYANWISKSWLKTLRSNKNVITSFGILKGHKFYSLIDQIQHILRGGGG